MKFLKKLFNKEENRENDIKQIPPIPAWQEIVEIMFDKQLGCMCDELVRVIYSKDRSQRYVVVKNEKGIYTYFLEQICPFDEDEWEYIYENESTLPAMWAICPYGRGGGLFANEQEVMRDLQATAEYKKFF